MEPGAPRGEGETRRALAERREDGRVRVRESRLDGESQGEQVRQSPALRAYRHRLHRSPRPWRQGRLPQHQDPGAAVSVRAKLSAMMFLQFFVWGAWYTSIAVYMTNHGMEKLTHWPYTVNPIAAIVAPFFLGLVADRYFATEKVLGVLHLLGSGCRYAASLGSTRWRNSATVRSMSSSPPRCCCASRSLPTTTSPRSSWGTPALRRSRRRSLSVRCPRSSSCCSCRSSSCGSA